jgi:type II secretory pathway component PulC
MGLQNGDIVHGVNEHPISTPAQVRAAAQNLMSATTLLLDIVRGGTSGTIRYDIVP